MIMKKWSEWDDMCKYPEAYEVNDANNDNHAHDNNVNKRKEQRDKFILRRYLESQITLEELCKCYHGICDDCPLNHNCAIQHACGEYEEK